ncbi:hypothetical protein BCV72DRAFT_305916 [Rhizopus microsporus var. microsporus]|uniref:Uncharacterized protein n=2 Tax=Rhizopus microsporus TaxID=58291 RepID=A0A2G4T445_RHIZD|nr:uncharacterized protein RHIMIDRAFT_235106 [Rhizopus microsporus ATCC 52813]ORE05978.1 hypothetical protein BCV72DRAFT_305916 [Rhizopus microsporus var. microsporus]PHZ15768.1 hypothetical protein RHIMIDRAFT_235106 [Rhizopus microsporus ATCC 52813]
MSPVPHDLPKPFNITEEECKTLKIPLPFNTLSADEWTDMDELWKMTSFRIKDAKTVKGIFVQSINVVVLEAILTPIIVAFVPGSALQLSTRFLRCFFLPR